MSSLLKVYNKLKLEIDRAEGKHIWDKSGKEYLDFFSGIAVTSLGHRPPLVVEAIKQSVDKYMHISNLFPETNQEELASEIIERTLPGKVFFSNSGAEANEAAIKAARKYFDGAKYEIISFRNSFHGRTLATLAATGHMDMREGFGPAPEGFIHADYNFLASLREKLSRRTAAILVEVIQGEGGVIVGSDEFIKGLADIALENNILLIIDEIQTGVGRTGQFCAYQHYGIEPDIITLGKALGGGLPLGACILSDKVSEALKAGDHGSTFGGNPVACAASLATLKELTPELLEDVKAKGDYLKEALESLASAFPIIKEVRGRGLIVGVELDTPGAPLVEYLMEQGYIVNCTRDKVIRFLPPFMISEKDIDGLLDTMALYFKENN
ncbi:MAG: aspartate aminotransferase family protein [Elusimicrobia bacterium]|nr:aspartate aminotransferase family protein [Elusimicrobiota bacterium]